MRVWPNDLCYSSDLGRLIAMITISIFASAAKAPSNPGVIPPFDVAKKGAEDGVKNFLKDPDSAKFNWEKINGLGELKLGKHGWFICGRVNSKNSYGGYDGFQQFVSYFLPAPLQIGDATDYHRMNVKIKFAPVGLGYDECGKIGLETAVTKSAN